MVPARRGHQDLADGAVEIALSSGVVVYDALFLALAEDLQTIVVTDDRKLLKALEGTPYARLAHPLPEIGALI